MGKEKKEDYKVQIVATQTAQTIINENGEEISMVDLLVDMANDIKEMKRKLVG